MSALRDIIEEASRSAGASLGDLTVLAEQHDPYRLDTKAKHRNGRWLANQIDRLRLGHRRLHLRGLHYALVASGDAVKPNGKPYINDESDWIWLQEHAAKAARWLGYIPFAQIVDARNDPPVVHRRENTTVETWISVGVEVDVPDVEDLRPTVSVSGFTGRQPHHLVIFGEKTSLSEILGSVAKQYQADLYLPSGEISDTFIYQMAKDGAEDGRPMVVFTFADADPSGWQMPVSIGRKLQALRDLEFSALEFEVRPVALTVEQVKAYGLPSTPLKETERRASRWRAAFGVEQTEIDALATLRPDLLRRIAVEAMDPFFDRTLQTRVWEAEEEWQQCAQAALEDQIDKPMLEALRHQAAEKLALLRTEIEGINAALRSATNDLYLELPPAIVPEPELDGEPDGNPLISTSWSWAETTRALIAHKSYLDGAGGGA